MKTNPAPIDRKRAFRVYLWGHAGVLLGAWLTSVSGSMWPLALGGSASLMLAVPLVRSFLVASRRHR